MEGCERYEQLLSLRLDQLLEPEEERALEAHLRGCPDCRRLAEELAELQAAFPLLEEVSPPPGFAQGVMERVRAQSAPKVVPLFRRPQFRALAGLAACFLLGLGVYQAGLLAPALEDRETAVTAGAQEPAAVSVQAAADTGAGDVQEEGPAGPMIASFSASPTQVLQKESADLVQDRSAQDGAPALQQAQYLQVCYGHTPVAPSAQVIGSVDSLEAFLAQFPEDDLSQVGGQYDAAFFETARLVAVVLEESSGYQLAPGGLEPDRVTVLRQAPEAGDGDRAAWLILVQVDHSFQDGDVLEVVFEQ